MGHQDRNIYKGSSKEYRPSDITASLSIKGGSTIRLLHCFDLLYGVRCYDKKVCERKGITHQGVLKSTRKFPPLAFFILESPTL